MLREVLIGTILVAVTLAMTFGIAKIAEESRTATLEENLNARKEFVTYCTTAFELNDGQCSLLYEAAK